LQCLVEGYDIIITEVSMFRWWWSFYIPRVHA